MSRSADAAPLRVPELGPSLGRLVVNPAPFRPRPEPWVQLDDIRYELATTIMDRAGEAREWGHGRDPDLALAALNRTAWLSAWEAAVRAVADRCTQTINSRLAAAAAETRMPKARAERLFITAIETRAITARLSAGAGPFLDSLDALEATIPQLRAAGTANLEAQEAWQRGLTTCARRLEAAWLALEEALEEEWGFWSGEVERARAWRRPAWPMWVLGVALLAAATWLGLVFGGYVISPQWFRPVAAWWWVRF